MKKIVLGLLAVASLSFGFEEYYSFLNTLRENFNKSDELLIGSIVEPNSHAVVGFAGCDATGYFVNLNVINSYNSYKKEVMTIRYGFEEKDKLCDIVNTATNIGVASGVTDNEGKVHEFGTEYYNGGKDCVAQYLDVTSDKYGKTIPVTNMACYGIKPLDPILEKPALDKYTGGKPSEYFNANYNKILAWNDKNSDGINALFLDNERELRDTYTTKEILDIALKSDTVGTNVDQSGVLLYILDLDKNDRPVIYIGDKSISITNEMLDKAPALKEAYKAYVENKPAKYVYGCEDSLALAEGAEGIPTGYIYSVVNDKKVSKYPIINNNAKSVSPFLCNAKMEGKEFTQDQAELLKRAGILLTKPVIIDENKKKEIDDEPVAKKPASKVSKDNSPRGKAIELLKSAEMPGLKIDEKGRFLGEVIANGEGTMYISLPNDEELEIEIPANSPLNIIAKDTVASARDLQNTAYAYGCDFPLVEKPGKNTPEIGVVYVVYNGHAVASVPALVNGSFKCNKQMVNRLLTQKDYLNYYSLAMEKLQKKPAFK